MPKFFFDTFDGTETSRDEVGLDLPNQEAARETAHTALPAIAADKMPDGYRRDFVVDVRNDREAVIYTCTLQFTARWLDHFPPGENDNRSGSKD